MARITLTGNITYYVDPVNGLDSNTGLTSLTAWKTLSNAAGTIGLLDLLNFNVNVNAAAGTYQTGDTFKINGGIPGNSDFSTITLTGDTSACGSILNLSANQRGLFANMGGKFQCAGGFTIQSASNSYLDGTCGLRAEWGGTVYSYGPMKYGILEVAISGERCGIAYAQASNYTIFGDQYYHIAALENGLAYTRNQTVILTGTPAFHACTAYADRNSFVSSDGVTWSGSATGTRYIADGQSYVFTNNAGANYFPGNAAGFSRNGGTYY